MYWIRVSNLFDNVLASPVELTAACSAKLRSSSDKAHWYGQASVLICIVCIILNKGLASSLKVHAAILAAVSTRANPQLISLVLIFQIKSLKLSLFRWKTVAYNEWHRYARLHKYTENTSP